MAKKLRQVVINGSDPYELKDQLIDQVVTSTAIGNSTTATEIKQEIETAVTGTTASSSGMTIKEALTALRNSITNKDVGVTDVSADTSTTGKIILKQSKNGGAPQAITDAEIGTATLTIQKNSTNVATFGANASSNVTANIVVPTKTSEITNDSGYITTSDIANKADIDDVPTADEEDITEIVVNQQNVLQLKDKVYDTTVFSGLGRKYLRKNIVNNVNVLTSAMVSSANTVYHIQYDYDLNGQTINLPAGSVLKFDGGSLNNGTLNGNNTAIDAGSVKIFGNSLSVSGTFTGDFNFFWLGAKAGDSTFDNSPILQRWWDVFAPYGFGKLFAPRRTYYFSTPVAFSQNRKNIYIDFNDSTLYATLEEGETFLDFTPASSYNENFIFRNAIVTATSLTKGTKGIRIKTSNMWTLGNIQIWSFEYGLHLTDVYYGVLDGMCCIRGCRVGVLTTGSSSHEINTVDLRNLKINSCTENEAKTLVPQNSGESESAWAMRWARCGIDAYTGFFTTKMSGMTIESTDYGIRLNYSPTSAGSNGTMLNELTISECYFENISTRSIYQGYGNMGEHQIGTGKYLYHLGNINVINNRFTDNKVRVATGDWTIRDNQPVVLYVVTTGYSLTLDYDNSVTLNTDDWVETNVAVVVNNNSKILSTQKNTSLNGTSPVVFFNSLQQACAHNYLPKLITNLVFGSTKRKTEIRGLTNVSSDHVIHLTDTFKPLEVYTDAYLQNSSITGKTAIRNSQKMLLVDAKMFIVRNLVLRRPYDTNVLPFYTLIRYMKAGIAWEGYTDILFTVDKLIVDTTEHVVRYNSLTGKIAIYDVAYLASHSTMGDIYNGTAYNADTGYVTSAAYNSTRKVVCDVVLGCKELPEWDEINDNYQNLSSPAMNSIRVSRSEGKAYIWNGTAWAELTDYKTRYEYPYSGSSLSERVRIPYMSGEKYVNNATGIEYVYTSSGWKSCNQPTGISANISSSEVQVGDSIFDTALGYPVWWNGTNWVGSSDLFVETDPVFTASAAHGITSTDIANWNAKQDSLVNTQNPYTAQGTSTKVPTITTNNLGQVTTITETNIDFPTLSKGTTSGSGNAVTDISVSGHTITLTKGSTFGTYSKPSGGIPATDLATAVSQRLLPEGSGSTDDGKIVQYSYTGGGWQLVSPDITPTSGSNKPITSGAVYTALGDIETLLAAI